MLISYAWRHWISSIVSGRRVRGFGVRRRIASRGHLERLEDRTVMSVTTLYPAVSSLVSVVDINSSQQAGAQSEVGIAINPTNPLNMVTVANNNANLSDLAAYFSTDGGQSWTPSFIDNTQDGQGAGDIRFDPNVAFDSDGNVYAMYSLNTGAASRLMVVRSSDGGATWTQSTTVTTDGGNNNLHTATITTRADPAGADDVLVIWARVSSDETIQAALSTDGGATFPVVNTQINDAAPERTFLPWAVADEFGNFHVTWEVDDGADGSNPEGRLLSDTLNGTTLADGGDVFVSNLQITDFANANSKIPAQPNRGLFSVSTIDVDHSGGPFDGRIYVSYSDRLTPTSNDLNIFVRFSDNGGATWSTPVQINDDSTLTSQFMPRMSIDQTTGHIYVAWYDARNDTTSNRAVNVYSSVSDNGGATWSPNVRVSQEESDVAIPGNNGNDYTEYLGMSAREGGAYVAWTDKRASNFTANAEDVFVGFVAFAGQDVTVSGDLSGVATSDNIALRLDPTGSFVQVTIGGAVVLTQAKTALDTLTIQGLGGNDTLTVDWINGNPVPSGGLSFDGGAPSVAAGDRLIVTGTGAQHGVYTPDSLVNGSGVIDVDGARITLRGLEPVTVSGMAEFTFVTPNSDDTITIDSPAAGQNRISGSSGGAAFESLTFFGITDFLLDTATNDGPLANTNDRVTFSSDLVAAGLSSFTVNLGDGNDEFNGSAMTAASLTGINVLAGAGDDILTCGAKNNRLEGGTGNDRFVTSNDLNIDTLIGGDGYDSVYHAGTAGDDEFTVRVDVNSFVNGLGAGVVLFDFDSVEAITVSSGTATTVDSVQVQASSGATALRQIDIVEFNGAGTEHVIVVATDADETITIDVNGVLGLGPAIHIYEDNDQIGGIDTLDVRGMGGNDSITQTESDPDLALVLNGGNGDDRLVGGAESDTMNGGDGDDIFVGNGGSDSITGGAGGDAILVEGTADGDLFNLALNGGGDLLVTTNGVATTYTTIAGDSVEAIDVHGLDGSDNLTVNSTNGAISMAINFDGGDNFDRLALTGGTATVANYRAGPGPGEGSHLMIMAGVVQTVTFTHVEPVIDLVGGTLFVVAPNDDNSINYTQALAPANGLVSIDGFETIEFSNKTTLILNGSAGHDTFNLDNPAIPTGLTSISVDGGGPTASDTLVVNALSGSTGDNFRISPSGQGIGIVEPNRSLYPQVSYAGIETIEAVLQFVEDDAFSVDGTTGDDLLQIVSGAVPGQAFISGAMDRNSMTPFGPFTLPAITVRNNNPAGSLTGIFNFFGVGGLDDFEVVGTDSNDTFSISPVVPRTQINHATNGQLVNQFIIANGDEITLDGREGDDRFDVSGGVPDTLHIIGGDPSSSDVLFLTGTAATAETVTITPNASDPTRQDIIGFSSFLDASGVELIRYTGVGTDDTLVVTPGVGDDTVRVDSGTGNIDLVTSDALPNIEFTGLNTFLLNLIGGVDVATIATFALSGALPGNYQVNGAQSDLVVIEGVDGAGALANDRFQVTNPAGTAVVAITDLNASLGPVTVTETSISLGRLQINSLGGNDVVTVDVGSIDMIGPPNDLLLGYDGGSGSDQLTVSGTPVTTVDEVIYTPGPTVDRGNLRYEDAANARLMNIEFNNLEPIIDLVPAATLTVNGNHANNAINYTQGSVATNGLVSVDSFETIEFSNKANLVLNGLAGDDTININNSATPIGLAGISVNGGDPTGSDTVIVTGTSTADVVTIAPIAADAATVTGLGPVLNINSAEHLIYSGLGGGDSVTVTAPAGGSEIAFTPGATADSGNITQLGFILGASLLPIDYNTLGQLGSLTLDVAGGGRASGLDLYGTQADDQFDVTASDSVQILKPTFLIPVTMPINTRGISFLRLLGQQGDDTFNVPGNHQISIGIDIQGGDPSASDLLNFTGTGAGVVTVNAANGTIVEAGAASVSMTGVEHIDADAAGQNVAVLGTLGNDSGAYAPLGSNSGRITELIINTTLLFQRVGLLTVNGNGGDDRLTVAGTTAADTFAMSDTAVLIAGQQGVDALVNCDALAVMGLEGSDIINATPGSIPFFVDGGDPIGTTAGDQLNLFPPAAFVLETGPEVDEGGLRGVGMQRVSWDHIEDVSISGPGPATIMGTNGDDDITVIARDATTHLGADGIRDFTVSVNDGLAVLLLNQATLLIDALSGDDDIAIRAPAPNNAAWNVAITVAGGAPAAATGDQGDVLEYETPGQQTMSYTPGAIPGTGVINDTTLASSITIAQFINPVDGLPSSTGSIERLILDGEGGNDMVTVIGTAVADSIAHAPGSVSDSGTVAVNNALELNYEDLGAGATLAVDGLGGTDALVVDGTTNNDVFGVLGNGSVTVAGHLTVTRTNYEAVTLRGQNGDDVFNVDGGATLTAIQIEGGDPSASDLLNYTAAANAATTVDLGVSTISQAGPAGPTVGLSGIEQVNLTSSGGASTLTVVGTAGDDTINVTPTSAGAGSFVRLGFGGSSAFTYTGVGGAFTLTGGTGGFDTLGILGNDASNIVTSTATTITINGGTVTLGANLDFLNISTFDGADNVTLTGLAIAKTIDAGAGNDSVNLSAAMDATILGGDGDDTLIGSPAADSIFGGNGNDILIGGGGIDEEYGEAGNDQFGDISLAGNGVADDAGDDYLFGGEGTDTIVWEPGDGSDAVAGGNDGADSLRFFGSAAANTFVLSANAGNPGHFNLNLGVATVDTAGIEQIILSTGAGADTVTVGDLSTTEINAAIIDLGAGDADVVIANGRSVADNLAISSAAAGSVTVQGLAYDLNITNAQVADTLTVNGNDGSDSVKANPGVETTIGIALNGNDGDDYLSADAVINGGDGNDTIEGGAGADTLNGNAGDDTFLFNAGTGIDTIDGGTGGDVFVIQANLLANTISVSETAVTLDGNTEVLAVSNLELFRVNGDGGNDTVTVSLTAVAGWIDAGTGDDTVNGSASTATLTLRGEDGNDSLLGSAGADLIFGGSGNDTLIGGAGIDYEYGEDGNDQFGDASIAGNGVADDAGADFVFGGAGGDTFIWEPGDGSDIVQGGDDRGDVLRFLGSAAANAFLLSASGTNPTHFNLNLGAATVDTAGVEQVVLSSLSGADSVTVNDLSPTEIEAVNIDLGVGDTDTVTYNGRNIPDTLAVSSAVAGSVAFQGLGYDLNITNATVADMLTVNGNEGDDSIKANAGVESTIGVVLNGNDGNDFLSADATLNGGNGNDTLVGGVGPDTLNGDAGDDFLTGNGGVDAFNGGIGTDTVIEARDANFTLTDTALTIGAEGTDALSGMERAKLSGGLGSNNFNIGAFTGPTTIFGDVGSDTLDFSAQTNVLRVDLDLTDADQTVSPAGRILILDDVIENVVATPFNDFILVDIALFSRHINGGLETTIPTGDRLYVDMLGSNPASVKNPNGKLGSYDGTVNGAGYTGTISFEDIETLAILNPNGGGGPNGGIPIDFGAASNYSVSNGPHSVTAIDVNGDGVLDMVAASKLAGTISVRFGNGFGGFSAEAVYDSGNVKKERSITIALSDLDNDGDQDIVVTNRKDNSVGVLLNNGAGTFAAVTRFSTGVGKSGKFPMSVKIGDMNNDGNDDIVTTNASKGKHNSSIAVLLGNGAGAFGAAQTTLVEGRKARDLVLGDFNADGDLDVVATNLLSREVVFMAGNGAGGLAAPVAYTVGAQPTSIISGDFNGDGLTDIAVTCQITKEISVLLGTGVPAIFGDTIGIKYPGDKLEVSINSADLNGDGNGDLIIANRVTNTLSYMLGLGNGTFDTRVDFKVGGVHGREPVAIGFGDFNNDGAIDLLVANAGTDDISVLLRNPLV